MEQIESPAYWVLGPSARCLLQGTVHRLKQEFGKHAAN